MSSRGSLLFLHRLRFIPVYSAIAAGLGARPGERLLDVGAGLGLLSERLGRSGATIVCLEPDASSLEVARRRLAGGNFEFVEAPAEQIPLPDESVDGAVASFTAHHWPDRAAGFVEIRRVIRPGGRFVMAEFNQGTAVRREFRRIIGSKHAQAPSLDGWRLELEAAGFGRVMRVDAGWRRLFGLYVLATR
jgi:ubiquinone/menaquinone biosynthesis C-methylase UbiE